MTAPVDWGGADRFLVGEAWIGGAIADHARVLCDEIGPRPSGSDAEGRAVDYLRDRFVAAGLDEVEVERFEMEAWTPGHTRLRLCEPERTLTAVPVTRTTGIRLEATPVVDVGHGAAHAVDAAGSRLAGAVALLDLAPEPFTAPEPHAYRLQRVATAGAVAALLVDPKSGERLEYRNAHDPRDPDLPSPPLPTLVITREAAAYLRRATAPRVALEVEATLERRTTANVHARLPGSRWPGEELVLGGHHDTVWGAAGGNDNASGTIAVLETARVLAALRAAGTPPGRSLRFVTFAAEEQGFLGSAEFVRRHCAGDRRPRLALNLDELSTGPMKGVVLGFDALRPLVQAQLDDMGDGLRCHVMSQLDPSSDHYPFLAAGIDAAHLWRWRFHRRHPDADYHHEPADTADKLQPRELKDYIAQLGRLLLRLSHVAPEDWPRRGIPEAEARQRIAAERGTVVRTA